METGTSAYKWYVLTLAALTHTLVIAIPTMAMPVLFEEISNELGLNLVQLGTIWGAGSLTGLFTGLLGGSLGDRFGANRALMVGCLLAGAAGAIRALGNDFTTLAATMLLFGFVTPVVPMNVHKTCGIWFSGRNLGLANGVVSGGMALGFTIGALISATLVSPWVGGWRNTFLLYGLVAMSLSLPWALTKSGPDDDATRTQAASRASMRRTFGQVMRLRNLWLLGLGILGVNGSVQGMLGYLPLYLRDLGWPIAQADGALATFHALSMLGVIPIAMLSDRFGARRKVLMLAALVIAAGLGLLSVSQGLLVWGAVIASGLFRDGFMAIFFTSVIETKGVGAGYAGTASGFIFIFLQIGNLLSPPIGNSLAAFAPGLPFAFWAGLALFGLVSFYLSAEQPPQGDVSLLKPHSGEIISATESLVKQENEDLSKL